MKKIAFGIGCFLLSVSCSLQASASGCARDIPLTRRAGKVETMPVCVFNLKIDYYNKPDVIQALKKQIKKQIKKTDSTPVAERVYDIRLGKQGIKTCMSKGELSCESWHRQVLIVSGFSLDKCNEIQNKVLNNQKLKLKKVGPFSRYVDSVDYYRTWKVGSVKEFDPSLKSYPYFCITTRSIFPAAVADGKIIKPENTTASDVWYHINFLNLDNVDIFDFRNYKPNCESVYNVLDCKPQQSSSKDTKDTKDTEDFIARAINIDDKKPKIKQWINNYWKKLDDNTHVHTS